MAAAHLKVETYDHDVLVDREVTSVGVTHTEVTWTILDRSTQTADTSNVDLEVVEVITIRPISQDPLLQGHGHVH